MSKCQIINFNLIFTCNNSYWYDKGGMVLVWPNMGGGGHGDPKIHVQGKGWK